MSTRDELHQAWRATVRATVALETELVAAPHDQKPAVRIRLVAALRAERTAFHAYSQAES